MYYSFIVDTKKRYVRTGMDATRMIGYFTDFVQNILIGITEYSLYRVKQHHPLEVYPFFLQIGRQMYNVDCIGRFSHYE